MSNLPEINFDEWAAEVDRLRQAEPERKGLTTVELCKKFGHGREWLGRHILQPLMASGKLVVYKRRVFRTDGQPCLIPEYSLKGNFERKEPKPKRKA